MDFETIRLELERGVARLQLDRPEAAHAIDLPMAKELCTAATQLDEDPSVRAVLLSSSGKIFCAGGDLASFQGAGDGVSGHIKEITTFLHAAISRLIRMRAPVVVAVNGTAAGAGLSLSCAADLAIAAASARFTMAYTRVALTPDGSSTYFLPRIIGRRRTLELALTNRTLSAEQALDWGIVNRVVPDGELEEQAGQLVRQLAEGPTQAFAATKRLVESSLNEGLETQMELETRAISESSRSEDAREGLAAFLAKRPARFSGR